MRAVRAPRGNSFVSVQVSGVDGIHRALAKWLEPELTKELDAANKKGAQTMGKDLRSSLRSVSKHMSRAVRVKRAKTGKPGWVVGSRRKVAFFWPFVIGGTRDHGPRRAKQLIFVPGWNPYLGVSSHGVGNEVVRTSKVRGVSPRPVVAQVAKRYGERVLDQIDADMARATGT